MTIPTVLFLHIGGNVALFWGLFKILGLTVYKDKRGRTEEPQDQKKEIRRIERELKRL